MGLLSSLKQIDAESVGLHELTDDELRIEQSTLVDMLQDIAEVCERNNIEWSLSGGSVLGCVRHKGFIPWDDDMDIFMTRKEYERFKDIFNDNLSDKYELKEPGDEGYLMHYPQIYKNGTVAKLIQSDEKTVNCLFIDVFILENTYGNKMRRFLHGVRCSYLLFIDSVMRMDRCKDNLLKYSSHNVELNRKIKRRIRLAWLFKFRSLEKWLLISDKCFSKAPDDESKYVVAPGGANHYFGEIYIRGKMCALKKCEFFDKMFFMMEDSDYYLNKRYGLDYMLLPENGQKEKHFYIEFNLNK